VASSLRAVCNNLSLSAEQPGKKGRHVQYEEHFVDEKHAELTQGEID